ncbi:iron-sulfur cluster insertion protein [Solimonas aquatica]|uniref:Iron-sulfur cluster insertion protein ErpA n=1 Tax=Solimonas aquatica TaxID=489703 RepID=A0A1H9IR80_9GAMM|nr:iron-sulfur cluster insertion protein [Solimonas aquatica]
MSEVAQEASLIFCEAAANKVAELIRESESPGMMLRVYVTGGGCSGFQYGFAFEESIKPDDVQVERGGVVLLVDPMSLQYLGGAEIDFEDGLEGARFIIRNPNATSTCGCGSSFSVAGSEPVAKEQGNCNGRSCH